MVDQWIAKLQEMAANPLVLAVLAGLYWVIRKALFLSTVVQHTRVKQKLLEEKLNKFEEKQESTDKKIDGIKDILIEWNHDKDH